MLYPGGFAVTGLVLTSVWTTERPTSRIPNLISDCNLKVRTTSTGNRGAQSDRRPLHRRLPLPDQVGLLLL